jgi:hypothetical protein
MKKKVKILIVEDDKTADLLLTVVLQEFADELSCGKRNRCCEHLPK